jgi:hypothetical protein
MRPSVRTHRLAEPVRGQRPSCTGDRDPGSVARGMIPGAVRQDRRNRKLIAASAAFSKLTGRAAIHLDAATLEAERVRHQCGPLDLAEPSMGFLTLHALQDAPRPMTTTGAARHVMAERGFNSDARGIDPAQPLIW